MIGYRVATQNGGLSASNPSAAALSLPKADQGCEGGTSGIATTCKLY
jgi:hypothetical protein